MNTINRKHHSLKTDPIPFGETMQGRKHWEIRLNDRDFCEGDTVTLHETASSGREMTEGAPLEYTGRTWHGAITWVMHGPQYGLAEGWCVFGVVPGFADKAEDIEARLQYELENSCPSCGGSGHKDDCATDAEPVAWMRWMSRRIAADDVIEGLELCSRDEIGSDGGPAFPVFACHPAGSQGVAEDVKQRLRDSISEALGEALDCTRVWEAWGYGTMSQNDFHPVNDDPDRLEELVDAALSVLSTSPGNGWAPYYQYPEIGKPVLGYHPDWVDEDFCADGIRECFTFGDGSEWQSAKWDGYSDMWVVEDGAPTVWTLHPSPPTTGESK